MENISAIESFAMSVFVVKNERLYRRAFQSFSEMRGPDGSVRRSASGAQARSSARQKASTDFSPGSVRSRPGLADRSAKFGITLS